MKKMFTLVELITAIVVIGILAAIVIVNTSNVKLEANKSTILKDTQNIQTAVDVFMLEKGGKAPVEGSNPTLGDPKVVELYGLTPNYIKKTPKDNGAMFWLDSDYTVWSSYVDAPKNVEEVEGSTEDEVKLTWDTVDGATLYKIYKADSTKNLLVSADDSMRFLASSEGKGLTYVTEIEPESDGTIPEVKLQKLRRGMYLVTALDQFQFESAPVSKNSNYEGYGEGPSKDLNFDKPKVHKNPTAIIGMTPNSNINHNTTISWSYENSIGEDGSSIVKAEWKLNETIQDSMPTKLSEGTHLIELRVQDDKGYWSEWVSKEVFIPENQSPTAVISMTPEKDIYESTKVTWSYNKSTDPEGDKIVKAEWKLNGALQSSMPTQLREGTNAVELRVQDDKGTWSGWVKKNVTVKRDEIKVGVSNYQHTITTNGIYGIQKIRYHSIQESNGVYKMYWPIVYISNGNFSSNSYSNLNGYWHGMHAGCGNVNGVATARALSTALGGTYLKVNTSCGINYPSSASFADGRNIYISNSVWNTHQPDPLVGNKNNMEWFEFRLNK